jgi:adenosine deaminase
LRAIVVSDLDMKRVKLVQTLDGFEARTKNEMYKKFFAKVRQYGFVLRSSTSEGNLKDVQDFTFLYRMKNRVTI